MPALRFDPEQHFTCRQCARCCRRGWDIVVTPAESELYQTAKVERWYREEESSVEGTTRDPFEPIGAPGYQRIRKRADGACGFLSSENRCRLHEELGAHSKPLSCQVFPFRFHPVADGAPVVTASFCCPTVAANDGEALTLQARTLGGLQRAWARDHAEPAAVVELVAGRPVATVTVATLRSILREMLERRTAAGIIDLRTNVGRMARLLEDLSRHRVTALKPDALAEYVELTGRYAARSDKPAEARPPSALGRLLARGFLFVVAAAREQIQDGRGSGLRLGLRLRLLRLMLHTHGIGPGVGDVDLRAARRAGVDLAEPQVHALVFNYLRATIETLGTGRRPVVEEMAVAMAFLNTALVLAAMRAGRRGETLADAQAATQALVEASDLTHTEAGLMARVVGLLSGGVESLYIFAAGARGVVAV
jgi:Fe-S-cluster containining protein